MSNSDFVHGTALNEVRVTVKEKCAFVVKNTSHFTSPEKVTQKKSSDICICNKFVSFE